MLADGLQHPLSVFVIPPLATAGLAGWRQTLVVTGLAVVAAAIVEQLTTDPFDGEAIASRAALILAGGGFGALTAAVRRQRETELAEANATVEVAGALQVGLLPTLRSVPGFRVGLRYQSGEARLLLGGDFVDLVAIDAERLAFVIGDVCGHGPAAASLGTSLRAGWRTLVETHHGDPVEWLRWLDRVFLQPPGALGGHVTACTGIVDRAAHEVVLVSAGHPWPVLVGRATHLVEVHAGKPMGLVLNAADSWTPTTVRMAPGDQLLLYTDGLIEARVEPGSRRRRGHEALLAHLVDHATDDQEALLDGVVDAMATDGDGFEDDVAVLLIGGEPSG